MNATDLNRHTFPHGGWVFLQPQTGWRAPTPTSSTFDQTVVLIYEHRQGNRAIVAKHKLSLDLVVIGAELENFTRNRLKIPLAPLPPPPPKRMPPRPSSQGAGAVVLGGADSNRNSVAFGLKRSAQGSAVVLDWLGSGGNPVAQDLANKRAATCITCPMNVPGSWYTTAPAEIIKEALEARKDLHLETPYDAQLKSCHICRCLMRLKVWCPLSHILAKTRPEILAEFPQQCWIAKRDQF